MLENQTVEIFISPANYKHFENLGYRIEYHTDKQGIKRVKKNKIKVKAIDLPSNSHALVKVKCLNCGEVIEKEYRQAIKSNNFCDVKCKGKYMAKDNLKSFENKIKEDAYTYLTREYIENKKTLRQIAKEVYGNEKNYSSIGEWMRKLNIPIRQGSEAVKTQWINNDDRRIQASNTMKNNHSKIDRSFMKCKEYRRKQSLSKMGVKNGMYGVTREKHHNWNPNRTHEQRVAERKTYEVSVWRKEVFERDNYTCKCCGYDKGNILVAHHMYSYHEYEKLRTEVSNGVTLCDKCHKEFHSKYGYGNNTKEQFEEFIKARF